LECNLQIGYRGLLVLCRRSGQITVVKATLVRKGDKFKPYYGTEDRIDHEPLDDVNDAAGNERKITHCYAVATFKEGHKDFELMSISEVEALRKKAKAFSPAWDDHYGEMVKKTVLRRLAKRLPQSEDLARLLELDSQAEEGVPQGLGDGEDILDLPADSVKTEPVDIGNAPEVKEEPKPAPKATPKPAAAPAAKKGGTTRAVPEPEPEPEPQPQTEEEQPNGDAGTGDDPDSYA
jgi:recombinational DNA repair protein RecT